MQCVVRSPRTTTVCYCIIFIIILSLLSALSAALPARGHQARGHQARDHQPRDHQPRDHQTRDHQQHVETTRSRDPLVHKSSGPRPRDPLLAPDHRPRDPLGPPKTFPDLHAVSPGHKTGSSGHQTGSGYPGHKTGSPGHQTGSSGHQTGSPGHQTPTDPSPPISLAWAWPAEGVTRRKPTRRIRRHVRSRGGTGGSHPAHHAHHNHHAPQLMRVGCVLGTCQVQNLSHRLYQLIGQSGREDHSPINPRSPHSYG